LCPSPQYGHITAEDYRTNIDRIARVLDGKADELKAVIEERMQEAAANQQFEVAATARDQLSHLEALLHQQEVVSTKEANRDLIGLARDEGQAAVVLMTVRRGRVVAQKQFTFWGSEDADSSAEVLDSFLAQYYKAATSLPDEVLVPVESENGRPVSDYLTERKGKRVTVEVPKRGERKRLIELAMANAAEYLRQLRGSWMRDEAKRQAALSELKQELKLPAEPDRIECYDISHLSGTSTVGSMVVFRNGESDSGHYRRFQIKHVAGVDDFASMQEVLRRRFARLAKGEGSTDESFGTRPDLVIIDGGKGQVSAAAETMAECDLADLPMIGLAKRLEEIVVRSPDGTFSVIQLAPDSEALYLLQRIRDEAHRFAITYNRQMRKKRTVRSALDDLPGIGPTRKKQLLRKFGSVTRIRQADLSEIQAVIGKAAGQVVKENL
jgi:excinuclease ABC subunit C